MMHTSDLSLRSVDILFEIFVMVSCEKKVGPEP